MQHHVLTVLRHKTLQHGETKWCSCFWIVLVCLITIMQHKPLVFRTIKGIFVKKCFFSFSPMVTLSWGGGVQIIFLCCFWFPLILWYQCIPTLLKADISIMYELLGCRVQESNKQSGCVSSVHDATQSEDSFVHSGKEIRHDMTTTDLKHPMKKAKKAESFDDGFCHACI